MFRFLHGHARRAGTRDSQDHSHQDDREIARRPCHGKSNQKKKAKAEKEILLFRDREVHVLRRPHKRSIGMTLQVNGRIRVSAPKSMTSERIQAFLSDHQDWIETHLAEYELLRGQHPPKRYCEGELFPFQGRQLRLAFADGPRPRVKIDGSRLLVELPPSAAFNPLDAHPELAAIVTGFFATQGKQLIAERVRIFSERMGLQPSVLCFRSQKTRWGSCSAEGRITLNWRLIIAPMDVIDYVVVHELAHLRHYNHSQRFWKLVASHAPGHDACRAWLKEHQFEADFLARSSELHSDQ